MEIGGGDWFPGQCVKEFKGQAGIPMKDGSLMGMFEVGTGGGW